MTTAQTRRRPAGRAAELPSLLSVEESAKLLGISRSAAYRAALADALPTIRWGRRIYVPTGHLVRLLGTTEDDMAARVARLRAERQDPWELREEHAACEEVIDERDQSGAAQPEGRDVPRLPSPV